MENTTETSAQLGASANHTPRVQAFLERIQKKEPADVSRILTQMVSDSNDSKKANLGAMLEQARHQGSGGSIYGLRMATARQREEIPCNS